MLTIILGVESGMIAIHLPKKSLRFALDDFQGVAKCLVEYPEAHTLCSSSCDFPQDDGAPAGWKWDDFQAKVEEAMESLSWTHVATNL